jgi:N-acetylglucosaminyldiphosphoundecaprenol N-acetyl-beta-D-mannosaminyltransferase
LLGVPVAALGPEAAADRILAWATDAPTGRYVCFSPADHLARAHREPAFAQVLRGADLVVPDGMGVVWALRLLGCRQVRRVYGPDATLLVLAAAERAAVPVGFYGAAPETLARLTAAVRARFPELRIAYALSPPFRPLTAEEDEVVTRAVNASGARILFVGLGTPKQEYWMAAHRGRIRAVMLGVGAAFDFLAGTKPQAPHWMMRAGLEWLFRLCTEPRRLWRRYLINNLRFVMLVAGQLLRSRRRRTPTTSEVSERVIVLPEEKPAASGMVRIQDSTRIRLPL